MTPTKLLVGQILVVLAIMMLGVWLGTQWAAAMLGYQSRLGPAWFELAGVPVYRPWALFGWWYRYEAYAPEVFDRAGALAGASGFLGCAAAVFGSLWRARQVGRVTTYGSARWALPREVARAGLFGEAGVFLGRLAGRYLRHDGPEHVMAFAPTRSGKGVGLVVPTLLSWTGSAVIHDIKGENWQLTAGWRSRFSHCLLFDPTDARSARYNPLLEVRRGECEVRDVQNIADILVDPEGALERRNHWEKTSHSLLVGAILHVLYAEQDKTLARVAGFLSDPQRSFEATLRVMMKTRHLETGVHPVVAAAARELLNKSDNERSGVLSTAMSFLGLYRDPTVAAVTAACDWRIADLVEGDRPVSLYLVVPPSDISRTKPLVRLVLNQIGRRLTERLQIDRPDKRRLLLMLDEFPALGRLDFFETALAFMAGYGIRAFLIAQSLNQIVKAYGENNSILDNCHVRVAFASNDERTARRISDALGTATEQRAMRNYAGHRLAPWLAHVMVSRQETSRPASAAADAGRGHAACGGRRTGPRFGPGADPRAQAALLRGPQLRGPRGAAAGALGRGLSRHTSRAASRLDRPCAVGGARLPGKRATRRRRRTAAGAPAHAAPAAAQGVRARAARSPRPRSRRRRCGRDGAEPACARGRGARRQPGIGARRRSHAELLT
jgi:type IV secretion system protein VirD4